MNTTNTNVNSTVPNDSSQQICKPEEVCPFFRVPVPAGWTSEKDLEHYRECFGEPPQGYYFTLLEKLRWNLLETEEVVNRGILLYEGGRQLSQEAAVQALDLRRKLSRLRELINSHVPNESARRRFAADLNRLEQVLDYRDDILLRYLCDPESVWLFELIDVDNWVGTACHYLNESLGAENEPGSYRSITTYPPEVDW